MEIPTAKAFKNVISPLPGVVAVRADAEKYQQKREHNAGVPDDRALVKAYPVPERCCRHHHQRGNSARNQSERKYGFFI
jgi:hypothetical protein